HAYWALGLVTLLPAWLVAFLGLLGTTPGVRPQLVSGAAWLLSAAAGLIGAIATEARVRETGDFAEAHHATRLWRLGGLALLPSLGIVLSGPVVPGWPLRPRRASPGVGRLWRPPVRPTRPPAAS